MSQNARKGQKVTPHAVSPVGKVNAATVNGPADPDRPYQSTHGHDRVTARQVGVPAKQVLQQGLVQGDEENALRELFDWAKG